MAVDFHTLAFTLPKKIFFNYIFDYYLNCRGFFMNKTYIFFKLGLLI